MSIKLWQVVLPKSRAFNIRIDKTLRRFFKGLSFNDDFRAQSDLNFLNLDPQKTQNLKKWEEQFLLLKTGLTEQQRRDRLASAWQLNGGQSPYYLQNILQQNGFDLFVYDWWLENDKYQKLIMNDSFSIMGGERAKMGSQFSIYPSAIDPRAILQPPFYPLVNKIYNKTHKDITIPSEIKYWRHFIYVAGSKIETPGVVKLDRKNEIEELILSIFPAAKWVGMRVNYV